MGQPGRLDDGHALSCRRTRGTETSHYPQEKKTTVIPPVVASERGRAQTAAVSATAGSWDREIRRKTKCNYLER